MGQWAPTGIEPMDYDDDDEWRGEGRKGKRIVCRLRRRERSKEGRRRGCG